MGSNHRPYILDPQNIVHRSSPHHDCMHNKKTTFKINWREVFKINEQIIQLPQGHMNFLLFVPFAIVRTVHAPHYAHSICQHLLLCTQRSKFEKKEWRLAAAIQRESTKGVKIGKSVATRTAPKHFFGIISYLLP